MPLATDYDTIIAGGGLSGLLAANEIASFGLKVRVIEEDPEVGIPNRCDGLVSMRALKELGIIPSMKTVQNRINRAILHSPTGIKAEIDASKQDVIVVDRSCFDKELSRLAANQGAEIAVSHKVEKFLEVKDFVNVEFSRQKLTCRAFIDARGVARLVSARSKGLLQAGKYLVSGKWFEQDTVELYFNQDVSPGFFTWVIPVSNDTAHVGVAGRMLNPFTILDQFIQKKGGTILKSVAAPIYVGGPLNRFVSKRIAIVGDAAGQTKPSTAGGLYSGGIAGILAGKAVRCLIEDNTDLYYSYEKTWRSIFEREFRMISQARRLFENMDNRQLDKLFRVVVSSGILENLPLEGDFDFHSLSFLKMLGFREFIQLIKIVSKNELRKILDLIKPSLDPEKSRRP